jgi:hypothetical protein
VNRRPLPRPRAWRWDSGTSTRRISPSTCYRPAWQPPISREPRAGLFYVSVPVMTDTGCSSRHALGLSTTAHEIGGTTGIAILLTDSMDIGGGAAGSPAKTATDVSDAFPAAGSHRRGGKPERPRRSRPPRPASCPSCASPHAPQSTEGRHDRSATRIADGLAGRRPAHAYVNRRLCTPPREPRFRRPMKVKGLGFGHAVGPQLQGPRHPDPARARARNDRARSHPSPQRGRGRPIDHRSRL